jgi:homoaconitate hydratase
MAGHAMANYDPEFQAKARDGDILVGGYNFGTGSSREQAATCLKHRGIQLVLAGSFSATYKRNAFNNGYICLECPALVDDLRRRFAGETMPTRRTGMMLTIDFAGSVAEVAGQHHAIEPLGEAAQELVLAGGLEALVRQRLS